METENKYYETGSCPYHIDLNNTAKEYSVQDSSNPQFGFLNALNENLIIDDSVQIEVPIIIQELIPDNQ